MTKQEIISFFQNSYQLNKEQKLYLNTHAKRFELILLMIQQQSFSKVLDVGPSYLSELLFQKFGRNLNLIGFNSKESMGGHLPDLSIFEKVDFINQDLNFWKLKQEQSHNYDLIICAEVIEHLYTSPKILFQQFSTLLKHKGLLIIQTPNAVSLRNRIKLMMGENPYEMLRENLENPGHFREYTKNELIALGKGNGFRIKTILLDEYFENSSLVSKIKRKFKFFIPKSLRSGITIVFQKV